MKKYFGIVILLFSIILSACKYNKAELSTDEIEIYNVVFNELQERLYPVPPSPKPADWSDWDSIRLANYFQNHLDSYKSKIKKVDRDVYVSFENRGYRISIDSLKYLNDKIDKEGLKEYLDTMSIIQQLVPFPNHTLHPTPRDFNFRNYSNASNPVNLIQISQPIIIERNYAIMEGGYLLGRLAGEGGLFILKKVDEKWTIIEYEFRWIS